MLPQRCRGCQKTHSCLCRLKKTNKPKEPTPKKTTKQNTSNHTHKNPTKQKTSQTTENQTKLPKTLKQSRKCRSVYNKPILILGRNRFTAFPVKFCVFHLIYFLFSRYFKYFKIITANQFFLTSGERVGMINSTWSFSSESASFLLIWFPYVLAFFLANGNFLFSAFSHLVQNSTVGQDSINCLTSPKSSL